MKIHVELQKLVKSENRDNRGTINDDVTKLGTDISFII